MENGNVFAGFIWICVFLALYMLPAIVAGMRHHHQRMAISVLTVLAGWTLVGWVVAMVWSCTVVHPAPAGTVPASWHPSI